MLHQRIGQVACQGGRRAAAPPTRCRWPAQPSHGCPRLTPVCASKSAAEDADDDDEPTVPGRPLRVERLLANLGYGKRRECQQLVKKGRVTTLEGKTLKVGEKVVWGQVVLDGEELDPPPPLTVLLHKPTGYVVTSPDDENIPDPVIYDLLPYRFGRRRPFLSAVGRLDKDTSGLLLLTDDGTMLHRINSPKKGIWKVYEATLADPLTPKQAEAAAKKFASGTLVLEGDYTPLLPARLERTGERTACVAICEGRYHQVRRMFAAVGHKVVALRRVSVGGLSLGELPEAEWRVLSAQELAAVFEGPTAEEVMGGAAAAGPGSSNSSSSGSSGRSDGGSREVVGGAGREESGEQGEGRRLTKKERKKGVKASKVAVEEQEAEEEDDDVVLVGDDFEFGEDEEEEGERGVGGGRRRVRRVAAREGEVQQVSGATRGRVAVEELAAEDEEVAAALAAGAGGGASGVRKYRDSARWRRRREALKKMLP